jgi:hypothetical protein
MGYFLLPYFILLILQRPHPGVQWRWILKVSLLSVAFYLQGSYHLWNWCILFLIFLGLFATDYRKNSFLAIIFSLLINSFRIVPVSLINSDLQVDFLTGFLNMDELFNSLIRLVQPSDALALTNNKISHYIVWWEVDHYIGWMGLFFILVFGGLFWYWVRKKVKNPFLLLYMPILCMVVISVGRIFKPVFLLHIPLLDAERVPSRFLIIPLLFLFVISAYGLQTYFDRFPINIYSRVIYFASLLWLVNDLQQHFELWSVVNANQAFLPAVEKAIFDTINNHPDPVYFTSLISGLVLSMAVLIFLVERTHRENKKNSLHPHQEMDCFENRPMP